MLHNLLYTRLDVSHICFHIADLNLYPIYIIFEIKALPLQTAIIVNAVKRFQATLGQGLGGVLEKHSLISRSIHGKV
jgi:hypothetical protein